MVKLRRAGSFNKRSGLHLVHLQLFLLLLAGRGGEGERGGSSVVLGDGRMLALCARELLVRLKLRIMEFPSGFCSATPLLMADGATPAAGVIPGIFFSRPMCRSGESSSDPGKGLIASAAPSGMFPGGDAGSSALRSTRRGGEDEGLDCFLQFFPRVFIVKVLALSAVTLTCRGFTVICTHRFD